MINATGNQMSREISRQARLAQDVAQTQIAISTGKRIQRASDDPVANVRLSELRTAQANVEAWRGNIETGRALAAQADDILQSATSLVTQAQELGIAGANQPLSAEDRGIIANGLRALADELESLAGTKSVLGEPLFAPAVANSMRFDASVVFAPVPSRAALFESGGQAVADHVRTLASAISSGDAAAIATARDGLDGAFDQLLTGQAQAGLNAARLDRLASQLAERAIGNESERSTLEDTDLSSAIARLNAQTITLEAAQAAFARINRRTLFDILR